MWALKFFEIPRQRVSLTFSNKKPNTKALNTNGHARHVNACAKGQVRIFVVNANIEEKREEVQNKNDKGKEKGKKEKGEKKDKAAAHLQQPNPRIGCKPDATTGDGCLIFGSKSSGFVEK